MFHHSLDGTTCLYVYGVVHVHAFFLIVLPIISVNNFFSALYIINIFGAFRAVSQLAAERDTFQAGSSYAIR